MWAFWLSERSPNAGDRCCNGPSHTPVSEVGITNGMIVVKVDDVSLADVPLADVANRVRGIIGSKVKLELVTPDRSQTNTVQLTRRKLQM